MADAAGQQGLSPNHAMACNPSTMVDPLGLAPKTEGYAGGVPEYGNEMAMRFPTMPNFMDRYLNFGERTAQMDMAQREAWLEDARKRMALKNTTSEGVAFYGTDAQMVFSLFIEAEKNNANNSTANPLLNASSLLSALLSASVNNNSNYENIQLMIWEVESEDTKADLGHTALQIRGIVYGFYPTTSIYNSKGQLKIHKTRKEFISEYHDDYITVYDVKIHKAMVSVLLQIMKQTVENPPNYSVLEINCTSFAVQSLLKVGIPILPSNPSCTSEGYYSGLRMEPQQLNTILQQRQNQNTFQNVRCIQVPNYYVEP